MSDTAVFLILACYACALAYGLWRVDRDLDRDNRGD